MTPTRVLILGYGRLGRAFCRRYHAVYQIRGVKRTPAAVSPCDVIQLPIQSDGLRPHLAWADVVLFCPSSGGGSGRSAGGRGGDEELARYRDTYLGNMQFVLTLLGAQPRKPAFILIGSTGVYPRQGGVWDETRPIVIESERQEVLWKTEQALVRSGVPYVVLRCGGLYGEERENFSWVRRRKEWPASELTDEPIALVHQDDVCGVVEQVIRRGTVNEIFNVRDDSMFSRRRLFGEIASRAGIPVIEDGAPPPVDRLVSNDKVKERLGYRFAGSSILDYIG